MRKFCIVLLLVSYIIPAIGVGVNLHWCGHVLFAISMDSDAHQGCFCAQFKEVGDETKSDCCKDDYVYYKLSQQHTVSYIYNFNQFNNSPVIIFNNSSPSIPLFNFANQMEVSFFAGNNIDENPPDLLMLGILRV